MSRKITQRELPNESGEIMRRLADGESFVIPRNGVPLAMRRHRFVIAEAAVALFRNAPAVDWHRFREDLDDLTDKEPHAP
jgi:hypothetical protein